MAIPKNKNQLIIAIEDSYCKLTKDLETIPNELTGIKQLEGHIKDSKISILDLVSYLIGWGELVLKWNYKKDNKQEVDFPETGYKWNELGKLAQKFYSDYKHLDYESLLDKLDKQNKEIIDLINISINYDLYEIAWYKQWTKGRMIQLNTFSAYKNASKRVRKWKKYTNIQ